LVRRLIRWGPSSSPPPGAAGRPERGHAEARPFCSGLLSIGCFRRVAGADTILDCAIRSDAGCRASAVKKAGRNSSPSGDNWHLLVYPPPFPGHVLSRFL